MSYQVCIIQSDKKETHQVEAGEELIKVINESGFYLPNYCGGQGLCGKCRVLLKPAPAAKEQDQELLSSKELEEGVRLACLHQVEDNIEVKIEEGGDINILTGEEEVSCSLNPGWQQINLDINEPELNDQRSYLTRILANAPANDIEYKALDQLENLVAQNKNSSQNKEWGSFAGIINEDRIVKLTSATKPAKLLGAAVDIGTTTLVFYLLDLETGRQLAVDSAYNPQKKFGADVITRVQYTQGNPEGIEELQEVLVAGLNEGLAATAASIGAEVEDIYRLSLAGNTIMLHTLLGKNAEKIARSPFVPLFSEQLTFRPQDLAISMNNLGEIELLPSISGYVGADIIADMLATGVGSASEYQILIDIGTNGEIALGNEKELHACSVAAGPSFEGGNISAGMAALPGAVDSFTIAEDDFEFSTIKGEKPRGICGSGLLDLIGGLLEVGVITDSGALAKPADMPSYWQDKYLELDEVKALELFSSEEGQGGREIYLTQKDIRQLQLAKGSIRAGVEILLDEAEISYDEVGKVYLVGGFANYLDPEMAAKIGMVPGEVSDRIKQAGNGAGAGARMMLLNKALTEKAKSLQEKTSYLELSSNIKFQEEFTKQMSF